MTLVPPRISLFYSVEIKTLSRDPRVQASLHWKRAQNIKALSSLQGSSCLSCLKSVLISSPATPNPGLVRLSRSLEGVLCSSSLPTVIYIFELLIRMCFILWVCLFPHPRVFTLYIFLFVSFAKTAHDECPPLNYHNPMAPLPLAVMVPLPLPARAICSLQSGKCHEQDQQLNVLYLVHLTAT